LNRFGCLSATNPEQVLQGGGIDGLDIERIAAINESEKKSIALCDLQQTVNEQSRTSAHIRTDDFGDCAFAQTAIGRSIEKGSTNLSPSMSGRMAKAFRQKFAQIDNFTALCHSLSISKEINMFKRTFFLECK